MRTISLQIPDSVDFDDKEVLMLIASKLYERGKLTLGQAAEVVGLSKAAFMEILGSYNVSVFNHPVSDLDQDIDNAKGHRI